MVSLYKTEHNNHTFTIKLGADTIYMDDKEVGRLEKDHCVNRYGRKLKSQPLYRAYDNETGDYCQDYTIQDTLEVFSHWYFNQRNPPAQEPTPSILDERRRDMEAYREIYVSAVKDYIKEAFNIQSEYALTEEQIEDLRDSGECFCVSVPLRHETVTVSITKVVKKDDKYFVDGEECDSEYSQEWHSDVWCNTSLSDLEGIAEFINYWHILNKE